jgi:hypothetical protein
MDTDERKMSQRPRSHAALWCSGIAVGLFAAAAATLLLGSATGFWLLFASGFVVTVVSLGITSFELLAGYRGWPQTTALVVGGIVCLLTALFMAFLASGGAGT